MAYNTLSDPALRMQYDTHMGGGWAMPGSWGGAGSSRAARPRPKPAASPRPPEEEFYGRAGTTAYGGLGETLLPP
jgi:hypothetical protein